MMAVDASANAFDTTTQAATLTTVPTVSVAAAAITPVTGQKFTITEVAAGDFTADTAGKSFIDLALTNSASWLSIVAGTTSTAFKVSAPTSVGIASAVFTLDATKALAAADLLTIGINGDTWQFSSSAVTAGQVTVFKNGVAQNSVAIPVPTGAGAAVTQAAGGLAGLVISSLNNAYGAGTAVAGGTANVVTLYSSNAYFNLTGGQVSSGSATISDPGITAAVSGTMAFSTALGFTGASAINGTTGVYTPVITTDAAPVDTSAGGATGSALLIPILKNNGTSPATITLSNMQFKTGTTAGDFKVKISSNSTAAGVSKGSSTVIATGAAAKFTGSFGTAATLSPTVNSSVGAPTITLVENLPGTLANNGTVTFTLPTGATWTFSTPPTVSATSSGGTTTVASVTSATGNKALVLTVGAAGASTVFPSTIAISGLSITTDGTLATGTGVNAVVTSSLAALDTVLASSTGYNVANVQAGTIASALVGTAPTVYTQRTYAAGINGGALTDTVSLAESVPASIANNTSINIDFVNGTFVNSATGYPDFGGTTTNAFGLTGSSSSNAYATVVTAGGYNATGTTFTNGAATWTTNAASSALTNTRKVTFPGLIVGNAAGPVTVKLTSNTLGATSAVTIANAVAATNASTSGTLSSLALSGSAVSLPTIVITEVAPGALATTTAGPGNITVALSNASFDTSATAKWCGTAITASNITGGNTGTLTVNLPSVSTSTTGACKLELSAAAKASLSAAVGAGVTATINPNASITAGVDTAQATRQEIVVGSVGTTSSGSGVSMIIPAATATGALTAQTITGSLTPASSDLGADGSVFVAGVAPASMGGGVFFLTPPSNWTLYNGVNAPNAYSTGPLAAVPVVTIAAGFNVTAAVGAKMYVGYGKSNVFAPASSAFNSMVNQGTYALVYTIK